MYVRRVKMKKTKIVCTIGPSTDDENIMRELMKNGMDVARFNFSHSLTTVFIRLVLKLYAS
jgi:pyruvate kinase